MIFDVCVNILRCTVLCIDRTTTMTILYW